MSELGETKRIAKNSLLFFSANLLSRLLALIAVIFFIQILGAGAYGEYSFALAFVSALVVFSDLGLHSLVVKDVAREPEHAEEYFRKLFALKMGIVAAVLAVIGTAVFLFGFSDELKIIILLLALAAFLNSFADFIKAFFKAYERFGFEFVVSTSSNILTFLLAVFVLFSGYGLLGFVSILFVGATFNFAISLFIIRKFFFKGWPEMDTAFWANSIKTAAPFGVLLVLSTFYFAIDVFIINFLGGETLLGFYSVAYNIIIGSILLAEASAVALFPFFSRLQEGDKTNKIKNLRKSMIIMGLIGIVISILLFFLSQPLIELLFGQGFSETISALRILSWSIPLLYLNFVLFSFLMATGKEYGVVAGLIIASAANIALDILLFPLFGIAGVGSATVFSQIVLLVLLLYFNR